MKSGSDSTIFVVRKASVWLCDNGKSEYTGYIRAISPVGFTAVLSPRGERPSEAIEPLSTGQPLPDLAQSFIGRRFVAAICGQKYSALVDALATEVEKLTGSTFDYSVTCRFTDLDSEQKKLVICLIVEHYAPPQAAI